MTDYTELRRLAEDCGDLNWRAIQENWCEWAIRDDHGYIATMRTKSAKHPGPCPDREAKAKFLCAVTPAAVLALIAENEQAKLIGRIAYNFDGYKAVLDERDQLKVENERLRNAAVKVIEMNRQHAEDQYGDADKAESWSCVTVLRAAIGKGEQS